MSAYCGKPIKHSPRPAKGVEFQPPGAPGLFLPKGNEGKSDKVKSCISIWFGNSAESVKFAAASWWNLIPSIDREGGKYFNTFLVFVANSARARACELWQ